MQKWFNAGAWLVKGRSLASWFGAYSWELEVSVLTGYINMVTS